MTDPMLGNITRANVERLVRRQDERIEHVCRAVVSVRGIDGLARETRARAMTLPVDSILDRGVVLEWPEHRVTLDGACVWSGRWQEAAPEDQDDPRVTVSMIWTERIEPGCPSDVEAAIRASWQVPILPAPWPQRRRST